MLPSKVPLPVVVVVVIYVFLIGAVVGAALYDNYDGTPWIGPESLRVNQWGDKDFAYDNGTGAR